MRRQRISRAISLLAALLIPVCMTSGAFAEDYSSLSLDELTEMRNSINVEIRERKEAQEAEKIEEKKVEKVVEAPKEKATEKKVVSQVVDIEETKPINELVDMYEANNKAEEYEKSIMFEKKPSLWQKFKKSKFARAISYVFKIRIRIELPNALPEGRGE